MVPILGRAKSGLLIGTLLQRQAFLRSFAQSEIKFHDVIGTDDPDLSDFRKGGGKMIMYMARRPAYHAARQLQLLQPRD